MKKFTWVFSLFLSVLIMSCSNGGFDGQDGFDGLDGRDGVDGVNGTGSIFDVEATFNNANDFRVRFEFPSNVEVFETDVILVFLEFDQTTDNNGDPVSIFRPLPQTLIVDQGLLQYNFEHTFFDVDIFIDADFDFNLLTPGDTDNQSFRIAVIPATSLDATTLKIDDLGSIMKTLNLDEKDVIQVSAN